MSYAVVCASKTGNTEAFARQIRERLGDEGCLYCGPAAVAPTEALAADRLFAAAPGSDGATRAKMFLDNFDAAPDHPNTNDLAAPAGRSRMRPPGASPLAQNEPR